MFALERECLLKQRVLHRLMVHQDGVCLQGKGDVLWMLKIGQDMGVISGAP